MRGWGLYGAALGGTRMTLQITFTPAECTRLLALYVAIVEGEEAGFRAEGEVVTLLGEKLGEAL